MSKDEWHKMFGWPHRIGAILFLKVIHGFPLTEWDLVCLWWTSSVKCLCILCPPLPWWCLWNVPAMSLSAATDLPLDPIHRTIVTYATSPLFYDSSHSPNVLPLPLQRIGGNDLNCDLCSQLGRCFWGWLLCLCTLTGLLYIYIYIRPQAQAQIWKTHHQ